MLYIKKPKKNIISLLDQQKFDSSVKYRKMSFLVEEQVENDQLVIFNSLTKCVCLLNADDTKDWRTFNLDSENMKQLLREWFIVKSDFNEVKVCEQIRSFNKKISNAKNSMDKISSFTILPTTQCNARCFYCYEEGCEKITMDDKLANDVADFIISKQSKEKEVHIAWFGGEPLVGSKIIDIICKKLADNAIKIKSSMTSNGYLFDENLVKKAVEKWNLQKIQITLDGTENVYNQTKAYVGIKAGTSPFKRVIDNIELLVKNQVAVNIRLNISDTNMEDLKELIEYLSQRFFAYRGKKSSSGNKLFSVYCHNLFKDDMKGFYTEQNAENVAAWLKKQNNLEKLICSAGLSASRECLSTSFRSNYCMADSCKSAVILPDGSLTSCEHFTGTLPPWGNIYCKEYNADTIQQWQEAFDKTEMCQTCAYCSECIKLKNCPQSVPFCNPVEKEQNAERLRSMLCGTYKKWKNDEKEQKPA